MIKFFRKIRQKLLTENKFTKYLLYAIGEILLVVIGILIALRINSWNTNNENIALEKVYLERLKEDHSWNINEYSRRVNYFITKKSSIEAYLKGNDGNQSYSWINFVMAHQTRTSSYNELVSTGSLKIIRDTRLREMLDNLKAYTEHSYRELEYIRQFSVLDQKALRSIAQHDYSIVNDSLIIARSIDIEELSNAPELKKILSNWRKVSMMYITALNSLVKRNQEVLNRIECLQSVIGCED